VYVHLRNSGTTDYPNRAASIASSENAAPAPVNPDTVPGTDQDAAQAGGTPSYPTLIYTAPVNQNKPERSVSAFVYAPYCKSNIEDKNKSSCADISNSFYLQDINRLETFHLISINGQELIRYLILNCEFPVADQSNRL